METKGKLLDQMRYVLCLKHMSIRTEKAYLSWTRRFILFHGKHHPQEMGAPEVRTFLIHLAVHDKVAASTQNGALHALLFLYRHVLKQPLPALADVERAKRPRRVPTVFTHAEVSAVLAQLTSVNRLMASMLYGAGLRLMECVRLRVKDLDFDYQQITVRDGKGAQDRVTMLPHTLAEPLQRHLARVKLLQGGSGRRLRGGLSTVCLYP
jgi:integrase